MHVYIVYDEEGNEMLDRDGNTVMVNANGLNAAERVAKRKFGEDRVSSVSYTEI